MNGTPTSTGPKLLVLDDATIQGRVTELDFGANLSVVVSGQRATITGGAGGGGGTCANSPELLCLAGRAGTLNNPTLSTTLDGIVTGSGDATHGLWLNAHSSAVAMPGQAIRLDPSVTSIGDGTYNVLNILTGPLTFSPAAAFGFHGIAIGVDENFASVTWNLTGTPVGGSHAGLYYAPKIVNPNLLDLEPFLVTPSVVADGQAARLSAYFGWEDESVFSTLNGGTLTITQYKGTGSAPGFFSGVTVNSYIGHRVEPFFAAGSSCPLAVAYDIGDLGAATVPVSVRSAGATTAMRHAGPARFGDTALAAPVQPMEVVGNVLLDNTGTAGQLRLRVPSASGSFVSAFAAQAQVADLTYTLPATQASNALLRNDGTGLLSWVPYATLTGTPDDLETRFRRLVSFCGMAFRDLPPELQSEAAQSDIQYR